MKFDNLLKQHDERFFGEKQIISGIEIYPYYEIKLNIIKDKINTGEINLLAMLFLYENKEYYLQFFKKRDMKYTNEILKNFIKISSNKQNHTFSTKN
jgi:hypothetical protein